MVALLVSPIGRWLFGILAILAVAGGLYGKGRHDGRVSAESRIAAAVAAEQLRQSAVRAKALDAAALRELAARADANAAELKVTDYERELASAPSAPSVSGACPPPDYRLSPADVKRLRDLRR